MNERKVNRGLLAPVMAGFFIMGFCDIVAPITGHIAAEFPESVRAVSYLPSMVFLWFLLISTPMAAVMNRIGRKNTTLAGYLLTVAGLMLPFAAGDGRGLAWYFAGFALLGIGNTAVQVALNPLLATVVPGHKMTSYLTVGQIFRNTSLLMLAPIVTLLVAASGSWRLLLPLYAALTVAGGVWLWLTRVDEPPHTARVAGLRESFRLLGHPSVLISFVGIAAFIAADVAIGYLSVRLVDSPDSLLTTTGFYASRIIGTLVGAVVLLRVNDMRYLRANVAVTLALSLALIFIRAEWAVYAAIAMMGFTLSCVFATFFSAATQAEPEHSNEVSGLMIMAISAGAVSGPLCGAIIRATGSTATAMLFVALCVSYILWAAIRLGRKKMRNQNNTLI